MECNRPILLHVSSVCVFHPDYEDTWSERQLGLVLPSAPPLEISGQSRSRPRISLLTRERLKATRFTVQWSSLATWGRSRGADFVPEASRTVTAIPEVNRGCLMGRCGLKAWKSTHLNGLWDVVRPTPLGVCDDCMAGVDESSRLIIQVGWVNPETGLDSQVKIRQKERFLCAKARPWQWKVRQTLVIYICNDSSF